MFSPDSAGQNDGLLLRFVSDMVTLLVDSFLKHEPVFSNSFQDVNSFFLFADTSSNIVFCVLFHFFRLILVRNSAILASDNRGHHFFIFYSGMNI